MRYKTMCPFKLTRHFYDRRLDLINRYGIYVSQMAADMCHLS